MASFQKTGDAILEKTLLRFVPRSVSPDQISFLRIFSLPFIYYCVLKSAYVLAFIIFTIAAVTDALDGAMARTRNSVTETGKWLDAAADRGLMALVALLFIPALYGWTILIILTALELVNALQAYRSKKRLGINPGANGAGKMKMFLQCLAIGLIFMAIMSESSSLTTIAYVLLWLSVGFTLLQSFLYP